MCKLAIIGVLVAALVGPASAIGKRAPVRPSGAQVLCANPVLISPTRSYTLCGGRIWVRDAETGQVVAVSFWRLQNMNKGPDDRP